MRLPRLMRRPTSSSIMSFVDTGGLYPQEVDINVMFDIDAPDPDVGYAGEYIITDVTTADGGQINLQADDEDRVLQEIEKHMSEWGEDHDC